MPVYPGARRVVHYTPGTSPRGHAAAILSVAGLNPKPGHGSFLLSRIPTVARRVSSRPPNIQGVDFLIAGVASENRRAVGRDVDLTRPVNQRTMKVFQAGDGFYLLVGESDALDLWFRALRS